MSDNLDLLRQGYEAFSKGDVAAATEPWPEDFVWQGTSSQDLPGGGEHRGKDAALRVLGQAVGAWDTFVLTIDELVDGGDTVVALGHNDVAKDGNAAQIPVVHIWRFEQGVPKRLQILTDTHQAAQLLGIS